MIRRKQRVVEHIMEDKSFNLIKDILPSEWVIREFNRPDYGIDIVIELFVKINDKVSETLGEFIFVQVKSVERVEKKIEKVFPVGNVAKGSWVEDKTKYIEIDVIKYSIDTDSIYTIHTLGASVSVLLYLVDLDENKIYFICLNDYIEKILLPKKPGYTNQKSVTISIPLNNTFENKEVAERAMQFYGKRAKLLAAFSKFSYQKNELSYLLKNKIFPITTMRDEMETLNVSTEDEIKHLASFFLEQIRHLDIWTFEGWSVLTEVKLKLDFLSQALGDDQIPWQFVREEIIVTWHQLTNLGTMYEELCREWYLPKFISSLLCYPVNPKIINLKQ